MRNSMECPRSGGRRSRSLRTTHRFRGHSIEFRINAEDAGRNFLRRPGNLTPGTPRRPGVRSTAATTRRDDPRSFDSLIAKLVVTGRTAPGDRAWPAGASRVRRRRHATVIPFHRAVLDDPAFTCSPFTVHTL
jgi:acetyl-CoA/propionyl-CoA carboxylase biotin carboxyl carrier protein